jgi:hypothetical protein
MLRSLRILHLAFLAATGLYLAVLFQIRPQEKPLDPVFVSALGAASFSVIGVGFFLRARMVTESASRLSANAQDTVSLNRWRVGMLISFTCAESVVLFGFVLKILGAAWNVAGIFFVVGILLLIAWAPRLDGSRGT